MATCYPCHEDDALELAVNGLSCPMEEAAHCGTGTCKSVAPLLLACMNSIQMPGIVEGATLAGLHVNCQVLGEEGRKEKSLGPLVVQTRRQGFGHETGKVGWRESCESLPMLCTFSSSDPGPLAQHRASRPLAPVQ